jgi:hypothetical protein
MSIVTVWLVLTVACLLWYSTMTIYVTVRAAWDIRNMFVRLESARDQPNHRDEASDES